MYGIPPTVAIEQRLSRGGRKSTVGTTTEVWHFCVCCTSSSACSTACTTAPPVQPQTRQHCRAAAARSSAASTSACWRRWWSTARASTPSWPTGRAHAATRICVWTAVLPVTLSRASTASGTHHRAARGQPGCAPENEDAALRQRWPTALDPRQGRGACAPAWHLAPPWKAAIRPPRIGHLRCFPPSAPARCAPPAMPSWTRACSRTTASTAGAPTAWAPASNSRKEQRKVFDDSVLRDDDKKRPRADLCQTRGGRPGRHRLPHLPGHAPQRHGPRRQETPRAWRGASPTLALSGRCDVGCRIGPARRRRADATRTDIARDLIPEDQSRLGFLEEVGLGYLTLDRGAPTLSGRRGPAHPPGGATGQQPAGRVLRAGQAHHRPARARQPDFAQRPAQAGRQRATRWWWWSTTKTPSAAPTTSSTSAPAPANAVAAWVAQGSVADVQAAEDSQTGRFTCCTPCAIPLQARRAVVD